MSELELLTEGWGLIEAPRVDEQDRLYFSDVPNGGVYRRLPSGEIETVIPKRRGVGGMVFHRDGGLVISGRNIQHVNDGEIRVLFDPGFPGFNDLHTDSLGRVYVGSLKVDPFEEGAENPGGELWRLGAEGQVTEMYGGVLLTNGIGFSPDGSLLYHADSVPGRVWVSDVEDDSLANKRVFVEDRVNATDGLAVDVEGGVWVAQPSGGKVQRYTPDGVADLCVAIPDPMVTSLCFGGADLQDLYVVTGGQSQLGGCIYRTRVDVSGVPVPQATI